MAAADKTPVTMNDVNNVIELAQNAPLRNLREAELVSQTLQRVKAWAEVQLAPKPVQPTRRARAQADTTATDPTA